MKKYRLSLVLVAVLAIIATVLIFKNPKGTFHNSENDFAVDDTTNITRIFFTDKFNNSSLLAKQTDGSWLLNGKYKANKPLINNILYTLIAVQANPAPKKAHENIFKRMSLTGVKTEVYQKKYRINLFGKIKLFPFEKKTRTYYVGDATQDNRGTYMLMEGSNKPFIVFIPGFRGFVASRYSAKENDWRSHEMIDLKLPQISEVSLRFLQKEGYSFSLSNNNNRSFKLTALETGNLVAGFDTLKAIEYLGSFKKLNYEAIIKTLSKEESDSLNASTPYCELKITDKEGKTKEFRMWKRKTLPGELDIEGNPTEWDPEKLYALQKGSSEFLMIQYFVFDKIFRPLPWFYKMPAGSK